MTFTSTFNTFNDFLPPPPLTKSTPPPNVKSWIRQSCVWPVFCLHVQTTFFYVFIIIDLYGDVTFRICTYNEYNLFDIFFYKYLKNQYLKGLVFSCFKRLKTSKRI